MLGWSGFLINSHDPLRVHVLKHMSQNSLTSLRYSVAEQGKGEGRKERITEDNLNKNKPGEPGLFLFLLLFLIVAGYANGYIHFPIYQT